jgi:two-component sensor histidine kinase
VLHHYDVHDINFLTGFANVLAEAVSSANKNAAMRNLVAQQQLMAEELQHRVRNNLHVVSGMLAGYARTTSDSMARNGIDAISRRVMTLAQVYDSLLGVGLSRTIDLSDYLNALCISLPGLQEVPGGEVHLVYHAESVKLPLDSVTALGMVLAELISNSFAHAFPDRGGEIMVRLAHEPLAGRATLTVEDNGIGFAPDVATLRRGGSLVRRLVEQIGGTMEVQSSTGTQWTLRFPVPGHVKSLGTAA